MADLDKLLYDVNVTCPVCSHAFKAQRVRKSALVPAGIVHRTRGVGRTVNLCVEALAAETVFVERAT